MSQVLLRRVAPLWLPVLHARSSSQAALHHGGGLQGAHAECVSSHFLTPLFIVPERFRDCSKDFLPPLTGSCAEETSSPTCSSSAHLYSSRNLAGGNWWRKPGAPSAASSHSRSTTSHLLGVAESSLLCLCCQYFCERCLWSCLSLGCELRSVLLFMWLFAD